ncbi:hypothetical protein EVAR_82633_1 [Eumeta japonica]|uniref:Uncharacterized protein n=1 Tax=Eumeta variegata TaxID=151549 RepID=A0A4C1VAT8_EUMVA|nr:hypothetical protein EVAR_82633_1 [Eumeta japonica]
MWHGYVVKRRSQYTASVVAAHRMAVCWKRYASCLAKGNNRRGGLLLAIATLTPAEDTNPPYSHSSIFLLKTIKPPNAEPFDFFKRRILSEVGACGQFVSLHLEALGISGDGGVVTASPGADKELGSNPDNWKKFLHRSYDTDDAVYHDPDLTPAFDTDPGLDLDSDSVQNYIFNNNFAKIPMVIEVAVSEKNSSKRKLVNARGTTLALSNPMPAPRHAYSIIQGSYATPAGSIWQGRCTSARG